MKNGPRRCRGCAEARHRLLLACASPRVRNTALAPQRLCQPWRHPCKGGLENRWSHHQSWSDTSAGRYRPFFQNSCPHASLDLLGRPPHACESSCQLVRLSTWQVVAAEHRARGLLNADLSLSSPWSFLTLVHRNCQKICPALQILFDVFLHYDSPNNPDVSWGTGSLPSKTALLFFRGILG